MENLWAEELNTDEVETELQNEPKNNPEVKNKTRRLLLEEVFQNRKIIMRRGCQFLEHIQKLMDENTSYEDLLEFHSIIHNVSVDVKTVKKFLNKRPCSTSVFRHSGVRVIGAPYKIMICLPPKCGTTNWQKGMNVLQSLTQSGSYFSSKNFL